MSIRSAYVAAPFAERDAARRVRDVLEAFGKITVTATWIETHLPNDNRSTPDELRGEAVVDLGDVDRADGFVLLDLPGSSGGMYTELGYALGRGKRVWVISEKGLTMPTCLFYYLPNVTVVPTVWHVIWQTQERRNG